MGWRSEWDDEPERFRVRDVHIDADNMRHKKQTKWASVQRMHYERFRGRELI